MFIFMSVEIASIIIVMALLLSDEHLRRRDTVESKRICNIAVLVAIGSVLNIVATIYDWFIFDLVDRFSSLIAVLIIGAFCLLKELLALQVVIGWNLYVDFRIFKSYDHVLKKQKQSLIPAALLSFLFIVLYVVFNIAFAGGDTAASVIDSFVYLCYILQLIYAIGAVRIVLEAKKSRKPPSFLRLDVFLVPLVLGYILPLIPIRHQCDYRSICMAIAVALSWRSVVDSYKYVDPVTGFYNRQFLSSMNEYMEKSGYPNSIGVYFDAAGSGGKLIPVLNGLKPADAEIFSLGEDKYLVMAGPQSESAIRLLIKAIRLKASQVDSSIKIESSYAIREKDETSETFTKRLLCFADN